MYKYLNVSYSYNVAEFKLHGENNLRLMFVCITKKYFKQI